MNALVQAAARDLEALRAQHPLVLSFTNSVVQQITANMLLAFGAVPAMLNDGEEAADMLRACTSALLINPGTLSREQAREMRIAVQTAREVGVPWVLDPVAVGLLGFRTRFCRELLAEKPALIRGNGSEILALAGYSAAGKGPESNDAAEAALPAAKELAASTGAAVLVTGPTDFATDGHSVLACSNGHPLMSRVTGVGCAMGAFAGAMLAVSSSPLQAAASTAALWGLAGELAAASAPRPGSFLTAFADTADALTPQTVLASARLSTFPTAGLAEYTRPLS